MASKIRQNVFPFGLCLKPRSPRPIVGWRGDTLFMFYPTRLPWHSPLSASIWGHCPQYLFLEQPEAGLWECKVDSGDHYNNCHCGVYRVAVERWSLLESVWSAVIWPSLALVQRVPPCQLCRSSLIPHIHHAAVASHRRRYSLLLPLDKHDKCLSHRSKTQLTCLKQLTQHEIKLK